MTWYEIKWNKIEEDKIRWNEKQQNLKQRKQITMQ